MSIQRSSLTITNATFTGDTKPNLMTGIISNLLTAGFTRIQGASPTTVTVTVASPAVFTMGSGSAPADGTRVVFSTTGALPTNVTAGTVYFVKSPSGSTFNLATTSGGTAINTTGTQSGTHTANFENVLQSVATPQSNQMRFRFRDNGANCVTLSMENVSGSSAGSNDTTNGIHLLPAVARTFRIICTSYWFYIFVPGTYLTARTTAIGHVIWLPSTLSSTTEAAFLIGDSFTDSSTSLPNMWRNTHFNSVQNLTANWIAIHNGTGVQNSNTGNNNSACASAPTQWLTRPSLSDGLVNRNKMSDGSFIGGDPWVCWSSVFNDGDPRVRGMLWDAVFMFDNSVSGDTVATFDGNTWTAVGHLNNPTLWTISA